MAIRWCRNALRQIEPDYQLSDWSAMYQGVDYNNCRCYSFITSNDTLDPSTEACMMLLFAMPPHMSPFKSTSRLGFGSVSPMSLLYSHIGLAASRPFAEPQYLNANRRPRPALTTGQIALRLVSSTAPSANHVEERYGCRAAVYRAH